METGSILTIGKDYILSFVWIDIDLIRAQPVVADIMKEIEPLLKSSETAQEY